MTTSSSPTPTTWFATTVEDPDSNSTSKEEGEKSRKYLEKVQQLSDSDFKACVRKVKAKFFWDGKVDQAEEWRIEVASTVTVGQSQDSFTALAGRLLTGHPYETPMLLGGSQNLNLGTGSTSLNVTVSSPDSTTNTSTTVTETLITPAATDPVVQITAKVQDTAAVKDKDIDKDFTALSNALIQHRRAACTQVDSANGVMFVKTSAALAESVAAEMRESLNAGAAVSTVELKEERVVANLEYAKWLKTEVKGYR